VGSVVVGPRWGFEKDPSKRKNVFTDKSYEEMVQHFPGKEAVFKEWVKECADAPYRINSIMDVCAGTLILWVGWFYFNGGSALTLY
jgi:ammonia channel protein AmtB